MGLKFDISILEKEPNKRGDIFARLMKDLFLALGYDEIRLSIHKTGREVDIEGYHRTEGSRVIAECKATKTKTGGDAINKFVGVLDAERRRKPRKSTAGYFVSLKGFKETAVEQEAEIGDDRVILLDGPKVTRELITGRIIVSPEKAMERAGRCAAATPVDLSPDDKLILLAHQLGWIWLIYFRQNRKKTHFALIHADGSPISKELEKDIRRAARLQSIKLEGLEYLAPTDELMPQDEIITAAKTRYLEYLSVECGEITLEGLPADQEVGAKRLKLENIFVPLYLENLKGYPYQAPPFSGEIDTREGTAERYEVGDVISKYRRLAILAAPGGGKTTLLKRIAVAYASPERSSLIDDVLPTRPWLPLFIRCRQLGTSAKSPFLETIKQIPIRAEMPDDLARGFVKLVHKELISGNVLLLVDGLDEISGVPDRISFVKQLRTFLAIYPEVGIIVTSREAGFRIVGAALCAYCIPFKVADFNEEDILRLTLAWHKEVVGDRPEILREAEKLAETIIETDRVKQLAKNPLLLTTLLLVKRWVGQLPTKRTVLYGKAIEVLLMTWNVEGYEPIDSEEAIPQLAFLAFKMMKEGIQTISEPRLRETLNLARRQMPEILGFASLSVSQFIQRVELRSSLLVISGHALEGGSLTPLYEFRHLTFQEYLAAKALTEGYYPNRTKADSLLSVLEPFLSDEQWKEVIPLAAVLAGREVQPLVEHLINETKLLKHEELPDYPNNYPLVLLTQCIADEIQVTPELLKEGFEWVARRVTNLGSAVALLYRSKYRDIFLDTIIKVFIDTDEDLLDLGSTIGAANLYKIGWERGTPLTTEISDTVLQLAKSPKIEDKSVALLTILEFVFHSRTHLGERKPPPESVSIYDDLRATVTDALSSTNVNLLFAACWALAWFGDLGSWKLSDNFSVLQRLIEIWRVSPLEEVQYVAAWAICALPLISRREYNLKGSASDLRDFIKSQPVEDPGDVRFNRPKVAASLIISYYAYGPWDDKELADKIGNLYKYFPDTGSHNPEFILNELGAHGFAILAKIKEEGGRFDKSLIRRKRRRKKKV